MPEVGSRGKHGARLHFCIRCDFPIAVYGRLALKGLACRTSYFNKVVHRVHCSQIQVTFQTSSKDYGEFLFPEYPMDMPQPHGFAVPMSSNPGNVNFPENYPRSWNMGQPARPFESAAVQPPPDGFVNAADSQGRAILFQGEYGRNASVVPSNLPPPPSKDTRGSKGILMPQPMSLPPPPPPPLPHHMSQLQIGGRCYSGNTSHGGRGYGWQHEKRDDFRSSQH